MQYKSIEQALKEKKISEIINPNLTKAPPETTVTDAVFLMHNCNSSYVVVERDNKIVGVFSEKDITQKVIADKMGWSSKIGDLLDPDPVALSLEDNVGTAIDTMGHNNLYYIPLVNEKDELVNVISVRTLIRFLAEFYPKEVYNLPPRSDQVSESQEGG